MRWDSLRTADDPATDGALFGRDTVVSRTFDTPGFRGITFHEVHARSLISKVPEASRVPFRWTINPYRGCSHACVYCFARNTHTYLDLDAGHDFDTQIVVKINAPELLRRELRSARWTGDHIAMGTNVDCYQRAEGRYQLMPGIIGALTQAANPFSILTKGTLILRDIDLLAKAATVTDVGLNVSVGIVDKSLSRSIEPGTPSPDRRLAACAALSERGLRCGVLMGPVIPFLSDSPGQLDEAVRKIASAGAAHISPIVLHLRPGAREWFLRWLHAEHPELVTAYRDLYGGRAYAPASYQRQIADQVAELARKHGVGRTTPAAARRVPVSNETGGTQRASRRTGAAADHGGEPAGPVQLSLLLSRDGLGGDRQTGGLPGAEPALEVGGPVHAEVEQARCRQARGVALRAEHDHLQVIARDRQPGGARRVEAPFQHVPLGDDRARDLALRRSLRLRPDVNQDGARLLGTLCLVRVQPGQPGPGGGQDRVDRLRTGRRAHQSTSATSVPTIARPSGLISYRRIAVSAGEYACTLTAGAPAALLTSCRCSAPNGVTEPVPARRCRTRLLPGDASVSRNSPCATANAPHASP